MADRSMEKLSKILGHSSVTVTERAYVHLRPANFSDRDREAFALDLRPGAAPVVAIGQSSASPETAVGGDA